MYFVNLIFSHGNTNNFIWLYNFTSIEFFLTVVLVFSSLTVSQARPPPNQKKGEVVLMIGKSL